MNKLTKGAIATAAGIALLMGGAGTFAYWNSSVGVTGGTIQAGQLAVSLPTTAPSGDGWTVSKDGTGTPVALTAAQLSAWVASPGDKFVYTQTVNVVATGNNLTATLALTGGIAAASTASADTALASYLKSTAVLTATGTGITQLTAPVVTGGNTTPATYTIAPAAAGVNQTVTVSVTLNFPKDAAAGTENNTMKGAVNLSNLLVTLVQK